MTDQGSSKSSSLGQSKSPPGISSCLLAFGAVWVAFLILERVGAALLPMPAALLGLVLAAAGVMVWQGKLIYRSLPTINFGIAAMGVILGATLLGTLIVQGRAREDLIMQYGRFPASVLIGLGLDHIFDAWWFGAFIVLFALALVLVTIKRRMWETPKLGFLLAHLGIVVIIVGGFIGHIWGFKGTMDLFEGKSSNQALAMELKDGARDIRELPFEIRLEDFQIEHYESEYRFFVYERRGDGVGVSAAYEPRAIKTAQKLPGGAGLAVKKIYPNYAGRSELTEAPAGKGRPAMAITVDDGEGEETFNLFASDFAAPAERYSHAAPAIKLVWEEPAAAEVASLAVDKPATHVVTWETPGGPREEIAVETGKTYPLGGGEYQLKVMGHFPDFVYDMETKSAATRSEEPNNPALQVSLAPAGSTADNPRWLFAKNPDFDMQHGRDAGGAKLVYTYSPAAKPLDREILFVGKTREMWEFSRGALAARRPLPPDGSAIPELQFKQFRLLASAEEKEVGGNLSDEWKNPMVLADVTMNGQTHEIAFFAGRGEPLPLPDGKSFLVFGSQEAEAKAYRSKVAVMEGDKKVLEKTIAVNDALSYGGYRFYQSNYRKEDLTYSGLQVVRDPGLPLAYLGFVMISAGILFAAYVRPRLLKGRSSDVA